MRYALLNDPKRATAFELLEALQSALEKAHTANPKERTELLSIATTINQELCSRI